MWQGLPTDVQRIIERNAEKYVKLQRDDTDKMNHDLPPRLTQRGMVINQPDAASFRARLGDYYARWKGTIGSKAWALLESHVGKLG
jgi:TRAP-type transport system periplasmic protein